MTELISELPVDQYLAPELENDAVDDSIIDLVGEVAMSGCPIYPDCPTPNSCSKGCKYGG